MSALAVSPAYTALLAKVPPRVIRSEEQNEAYIDALYALDQRQDEWTDEEAELADLLTLLIEDFEEKNYSLPKSSPGDMLQALLEFREMEHADLHNILGEEATSAILQGRREPNTGEIRKLAEVFHVSPEVFF